MKISQSIFPDARFYALLCFIYISALLGDSVKIGAELESGNQWNKIAQDNKLSNTNKRWVVNINGTNYSAEGVQKGLVDILDSTNADLKSDWLNSLLAENKFKSFQHDTITKLIQSFQTEKDPEVRRNIFICIFLSGDKRFLDVCASAINDPSQAISKMAQSHLSRSSETFYDPDAKEIQFNGRQYNLQEAQGELFSVLTSTNENAKQKWLVAISEFRTALQSSVVPKLILQLQHEDDPMIKKGILHVIQFSRYPKQNDVYLSLQNDPDLSVQLMAGVLLIMQNNIQGVGIVTHCLPMLDEPEKLNAIKVIEVAVIKFNFDFKPKTKIINSEEPTNGEIEMLALEWNQWWNTNKLRYISTVGQ